MSQTPSPIFSIIQERAALMPAAPAILSPNKKTLTYQSLAARIETIALQLTQLGFRHTDRIAAALPPGSSKACVMDENGAALPLFSSGEICISGENVITGYENNPEANAASFLNSWLRTGDLGYMDEDGYIFITDRVKEIINRGGEKVSPREVDAALLRHPAVKQAAAFAVSHPTLGEDVAAAVVLHFGQSLTAQELRRFAALTLTDFKVPRQIVFLQDVPQNVLGKIQRSSLAQKLKPDLDALVRQAEDQQQTSPKSETEEVVQAIWRESLGVEVGIHDDFLFIGGDSLIAARILLQVNERFGVNLLIADIFDAPTIATMAKLIQLQKGSDQ